MKIISMKEDDYTMKNYTKKYTKMAQLSKKSDFAKEWRIVWE